jgi:hypothetical protein
VLESDRTPNAWRCGTDFYCSIVPNPTGLDWHAVSENDDGRERGIYVTEDPSYDVLRDHPTKEQWFPRLKKTHPQTQRRAVGERNSDRHSKRNVLSK